MIRVACPGCGVKLNAQEKLAGQTKKCPKCGGPVEIPVLASSEDPPEADPAGEFEPPSPTVPASAAAVALPSLQLLERLDRQSRYLICDRTSVAALWHHDGRGWMVRIASGFSPARRNREVLAPYGEFVLVELRMESTDQGLRLAAIEVYELASRFAMTKLADDEDEILQAVTGHGCLNRSQKNAVRQILGELFMREVWGDSADVLDFLANADFHSHTSRK